MKTLLKKAISNFGYEVRRKQPIREMQALEMLAELRGNPDGDKDAVRFLRFALTSASTVKITDFSGFICPLFSQRNEEWIFC
jgi:hypothetical protein